MKPIIAVDIDNVIADTAEKVTEFSNQTWNMSLSPADFNEDFQAMWGVPLRVAYARLELFYSPENFMSIAPKQGAREALGELKRSFTLVALTSRKSSISQVTASWLQLHYPDVFSELYFSGIYDTDNRHAKQQLCMTKGDFVKSIGAQCLIDDEPKHCVGAVSCGTRAILFGDYPWNHNHETTKSLTRCVDWQHVREVLEYE